MLEEANVCFGGHGKKKRPQNLLMTHKARASRGKGRPQSFEGSAQGQGDGP